MFPIPSLEIAVIASWEVHPLQPIIEVARYTKEFTILTMHHVPYGQEYCFILPRPCKSMFIIFWQLVLIMK